MPQHQFFSAAVIGTGMMGPGIALTLALGGVRATLISRSLEGAAQGLAKAKGQADLLAARGLIDPGAAGRASALLFASTDLDQAIAGASLVVESGPEDMAWKQELFARMDALAAADAVLASNTSGLSITAIAANCACPERVLTAHFWNPPHLMPLVELVQGGRTSPAVVDRVYELLTACGKTPVVVRKDRPGQLGNRLQMALVREAANIVAEGIADADAVDTVARNGFGLRMPAYGILEHQDVVGLDLGIRVLDYVAQDLYNEPHAPGYVYDLVHSGNLGAKTGRGFYDWSVKSADEVRARRDAFLIEVLRYRAAMRAAARQV
ncbi:MAG TPA: 3-hydroxyacyl-CoA dehydrogenase family protein [Candidatus Acidoferrales bacterium]|nr:3-hydroxyacyl-CoA dehydrogenase family protein [Candidatus Acidoferrales bacterium]